MTLSFKLAKKLLDQEKKDASRLAPVCDWKDRVERAAHRRGAARRDRMFAVQACCLPGFVCPSCQKGCFKPRGWVLIPIPEIVELYLSYTSTLNRERLTRAMSFATEKGSDSSAQLKEVALCRSCCMQEPFRVFWGRKRIPAHHRVAKALRRGSFS